VNDGDRDLLAAASAEVELDGPRLLFDGYRDVEGWRVSLDAGRRGRIVQDHEVLRAGPCVAVIAIDLARDQLVLIRQFRVAAHLAIGAGDLAEVVAGRLERGEDPEEGARRELMEETGLETGRLVRLMTFLPTPGLVDEHATMFLASVDSDALADEAGAAEELEHTRPFAVGVDAALSALADPRPLNGYLLIALQWLALNRSKIRDLLEAPR
jgi:ADP-ribose pyrophosphatase